MQRLLESCFFCIVIMLFLCCGNGGSDTSNSDVTSQTGALKVTIMPAAAVSAGAQWCVDGGSWRNSGYTQTGLSAGSHTVEFKDISGWTKPASQAITISNGQTATPTGTYSEPLPAGNGESLMDESEILSTTFVDLDFSRFPSPVSQNVPVGDVIYVTTTGNDQTGDGSTAFPFRSIAQALHHASSGSTVVVGSGNYAEVYESDDYRGLVLDVDNVRLMAAPGETVTVSPTEAGVNTGIDISANNIVIQGINLSGFSTVGILFTSPSPQTNEVITQLDIIGSDEGIATWDGTIDGLLVYDVKIQGASEVGFHCGNGYGYNWRLERVTIEMTSGDGGSGADAFAVEHGDNILLVNVEVSGASADGIDTKASRVVVYGCKVHNVERNGVKLWQGGDVINTLIHHTGADAAVVVEEGLRTRLLHTIVGYHNYGMEESYNMTFSYDSQEAMQVEIIDCIIFNTSGGAWVTDNAELTIDHSLFYGMENGRILQYGNTQVEISDGADGLSPFGQGNLVTDPALNASFQASEGGPTVDAGVALTSDYPSCDLQGQDRIQGIDPDLGPFELPL